MHIIAQRIGLDKALGNKRKARLALLQIYAMLITQGSRLYIATQWSKNQAVEEILGLKNFNEDTLYSNLEWLAAHQLEIEKELFKKMRNEIKTVYLYEVTSSYFEGKQNELAAYRFNRYKKKGKMQITIGLLCNEDGEPISVEVFEGNNPEKNSKEPAR